MVKNIAVALGTLGLLAAAGVAFAQTVSTTTSDNSVAVQSSNEPMVLDIGSQGHVLLRGTVASVSATSITVNAWGGVWTINVPTSAQVLPAAVGGLSGFKQGDFVGVQGTIDQNSNWTVNATLVRDWTQRGVIQQERQQNIQAIKQERQSAPRTYQGTVSNLSGESFTLTTENGTAYGVSLTADAKVVQGNWLTLDFSKVQNGDTVRVWGPMSSSTITASIFRDVTIH